MSDKKSKKFAKLSAKKWKPVLFVMFLLASFFIYKDGMKQIQSAYQNSREDVREKFYQAAYDFEEAKHHVSNDIVISIEDIREISKLEVLKVSDTEFIIKKPDKDSAIRSWLEVQGIGVFTVDLMASEFIADFERQYVWVKIPQPVLSQCKVEETGKQFWKNEGLANGSIGEGVALAQEQLREGYLCIEEAMKQNRRFYDAAKKSAIQMIEALIRKWNPDLPDLQVEVNFVETE